MLKDISAELIAAPAVGSSWVYTTTNLADQQSVENVVTSRIAFCLSLVSAIVAANGYAQAPVYRSVGEQGNVSFSSAPPADAQQIQRIEAHLAWQQRQR